MNRQYQAGAINLLTGAVLVGVVSAGLMLALMSMRQERNLFAQGWNRLFAAANASSVTSRARGELAKVANPESQTIRKCKVNGKMVYSNVECKAGTAGSEVADLHDTKGFEAPKAPPPEEPSMASASAGAALPTVDRLVEKAAR